MQDTIVDLITTYLVSHVYTLQNLKWYYMFIKISAHMLIIMFQG